MNPALWFIIVATICAGAAGAAALLLARRVERDCARSGRNYPPIGSRIPVPPARGLNVNEPPTYARPPAPPRPPGVIVSDGGQQK